MLKSDLEAIARIRSEVADVRAWLVETERKLEMLGRAPAPVETMSTDDYVREASSATAVYKALESELKIDRRTILAKVERLVKAHGLDAKLPNWGTDVKLAKHLASRVDGRIRLVVALEALG